MRPIRRPSLSTSGRGPRVLGILAGFTASLSLISAAAAKESDEYDRNWPAWRGPAGNGLVLHGNPPVQWAEDKNVKWKVSVPGSGHATPIIWGDKVFVLSAVPTNKRAQIEPPQTVIGQAEPPREGRGRGGGRGRGPGGGARPTEEFAFTTLCLDRLSGKVLWQKVARSEVPHQAIQPSNSYSSGSPVTDGKHLYVSFGSYGLYCYDLDGQLKWSKDLGKVNVMFGEGSSPALSGDTLIVVQDTDGESHIFALDKSTGRELWKKARTERAGWTTPFVLHHGGKTQVILSGSNAIRSYDIQNGEVLWQCGGLGSNPIPMIVANQDTLFAMSGHREPQAIALRLGRSGDLTQSDAILWKQDRGLPYVPSPLLYGDLLFFCQRNDAIVSCLDPASGKPHYAQERLDGITGVYASPIGAQNRIYLAGRDGATVVLERSKELKVLAANKLDDSFDASPAAVGNELFLRGHQNLYCLTEK